MTKPSKNPSNTGSNTQPRKVSQISRQYSLLDGLVCQVDTALRTLVPNSAQEQRPSPASPLQKPDLNNAQKSHIAGLMRINHTGEVCAQALYEGQALTAKLPEVRAAMDHAAAEEVDHLVWCEQRLHELDSHTSYLNPLWYGLSFGIGAAAGIAGDKWSLGFVAETESQVCAHLDKHLEQLPPEDTKSKAILKQMSTDEADHRASALAAGGAELPEPVKALMALMSKVMTKTTYRL